MKPPEERRRFIRLDVPLNVTYILEGENTACKIVTKNISAEGLCFESRRQLNNGINLEMKLEMPGAPNPVHTIGRVAWSKKTTLEDSSPYDVGVEFTEIEEDNKNTFLKYICDLIYNLDNK